MPTEQLANNALTTLAVAIDADDTAVTVASHAAFPATAQFRVLIHSELLLVTAGAGSATWTVTRGIEGTTPAPHALGSTVAHVLTAGALDAFVHAPTGVAPGSYSSANVTIAADGRITAAADGAASGPTLLSTVTADGSTRSVRLTLTGGYNHYAITGEGMYMEGIGGHHNLMLWPNGDGSGGVSTRCCVGIRAGGDHPLDLGNFLSLIWGANYAAPRLIRSICSGRVTVAQELITSYNDSAALSYIDIVGEHPSTTLYGSLKLYGISGPSPF